MALGSGAISAFPSYLLVGREKAFKTYDTCTAAMAFTSAKFVMEKDTKILEEINLQRSFASRIALSRKLAGDLSFYMAADNDACQYILQNAFGGGLTGTGITSATTTGDTVGAGVFDHVYTVKNFADTYSSLCFNHRKGDSSLALVGEYCGFRVDNLSLKAKVDDALMCQTKMIGVDVSLTNNDLSGIIPNTLKQTPLDFVGMRFSVETTFGSLTATSFWHVNSFELSLQNKLKSDAGSRRIGSDVLEVLPAGIFQPSLKCSMRFDDLTAYNAMLNQTQLSAQLVFQGATITGSKMPQLLQFDMPRVYIKSAGDPEVAGPDDVLKSDVEFDILRDFSTTTGYLIKATARNKTSAY